MNIIGIAIALALDAFGVAMGLGCSNRLEIKDKIMTVLSFGFFQFFFAFSGAFIGIFVDKNLFNVTDYVSGLIILILGLFLFKEGFKDDEECIYTNLSLWMVIVLGVSVSIDALGVGFSILYTYNFLNILNKSLIIGLIAFIFTILSFVVTNYIRNFNLVENYADYLGGAILIFFGLKMII